MKDLALTTTTKYWWCVADLAERWHVSPQMVRLLLKPYRGRCHRARRGKHPRLLLWVPLAVVATLDREREWRQVPA